MFRLLAFLSVCFSYIVSAEILVDGVAFDDLKKAEQAIKNNSQVYLKADDYIGELNITADDVKVTGIGTVKVTLTEANTRGFFIITGARVTLENISCEGELVNNQLACIWYNGQDLELFNMRFFYQGIALIDIAKAGVLKINYCLFQSGGLGRKKAVIDISSPELLIHNSQFKGALKGAQLIRAKSFKTKITNSYLYADNNTGRLIDVPYGGEVIIEDSLLSQSPEAEVFYALSYGSSVLGRNRQHHITVKNNLILLERKKSAAFFNRYPENEKITVNIQGNVFVGDFKDADKMAKDNLVVEHRSTLNLALDTAPDFMKVPEYINYFNLLQGR